MSAPLRVLIAVDGSDASLRAVEHVLDLSRRGVAVDVHVLNVQLAVRGVSSFVSHADLESYHRDEGQKALEGAKQRLAAAGMPHHDHIGVGDPGEMVVAFAQKLGSEHIVMGTHGRGGVAEVLLGSVAKHVVSHALVPVTLLR